MAEHRGFLGQSILYGRYIPKYFILFIAVVNGIFSLISLSIFSLLVYQIRSVAQSCLTLCDAMDCSTPGLPALHYLLEFAQTHVH